MRKEPGSGRRQGRLALVFCQGVVGLRGRWGRHLQSHNFHWNFTGPQFRELHLMFEEYYTELATAEAASSRRTFTTRDPSLVRARACIHAPRTASGAPAGASAAPLRASCQTSNSSLA